MTYIWLLQSYSPARAAAAHRPAPVSVFIHIAVQTSKTAGQKDKYYATVKGSFTHFVDFYYSRQSDL